MAKKLDSEESLLQSELDNAKREIDALTDALKRERADAINQRRHHEDQLGRVTTSVKSAIISDLLPVVDNVERALKHIPQDIEDNDYIKGVRGIAKQFERVLESLGVSKIPTVGHEFDPHIHEAVSIDDGEGEDEVVSEELQPGYKLGGTVIRHAMVRVKRS